MSQPTDLQLVQAAADTLNGTHMSGPAGRALLSFGLSELRQAEHDISAGRAPKPRLLRLAEDLTDEER